MKQTILSLLCTMFLILALSGCSNYGKEKNVKGLQFYYTKDITEQEADTLFNYMVKMDMGAGDEKTFQLTKSGSTYEFRMVTKAGFNLDDKTLDAAKVFATALSADVFNNKNVEFHFCDENIKTIKVIPMTPVP